MSLDKKQYTTISIKRKDKMALQEYKSGREADHTIVSWMIDLIKRIGGERE